MADYPSPQDYRTNLGHDGAWQKFERGEMELRTFYEAFGRELSDIQNGNPWYKKYCASKGISEWGAPKPIFNRG